MNHGISHLVILARRELKTIELWAMAFVSNRKQHTLQVYRYGRAKLTIGIVMEPVSETAGILFHVLRVINIWNRGFGPETSEGPSSLSLPLLSTKRPPTCRKAFP